MHIIVNKCCCLDKCLGHSPTRDLSSIQGILQYLTPNLKKKKGKWYSRKHIHQVKQEEWLGNKCLKNVYLKMEEQGQNSMQT